MLHVSEQEELRWRVVKIRVTSEINPEHRNYEQWRRTYERFEDIPTKTQEAVALLSMCTDGEVMAGVGQKISCSSYEVDDTDEILGEYGDG